jgi:hypothetical protein
VEPCVKGSLFVMGVVAVRRHLESGAITEDQLAVRLGREALDSLDQKIDIERWYPIRAFTGMVDVDWELAGAREPDYMRRSGRDAAARFFRTGIYQQLDYAKRAKRVQSRRSLLRQARLVMSVTESLYDFLETAVAIEGGRLRIHYANAALFTEALRYTTEGFMNEINRQQGASRSWTSERVAPDRLRFQLELPDWLPEGD